MWQKYKKGYSSMPKFKFNISDNIDEEAFNVHFERKTFFVDTLSEIGVNYAQSQLKVASLSGHIGDFLGKNKPVYSLRPLWITGDDSWALGSSARISLPRFMSGDVLNDPENSKAMHLFCRRILEMGYNSIVLGSVDQKNNSQKAVEQINVEPIFSVIKSYGIKIIIKPDYYHLFGPEDINNCYCPLKREFQLLVNNFFTDLRKVVGGCDYIFWGSRCMSDEFSMHKDAEDHSTYELILKELALLEENLKGWVKPIYFISFSDKDSAEQQKWWFTKLLNEASEGTIISFPVNNGVLWQSYEEMNSVWSSLKKSIDYSSTEMLPIANIGHVRQSEGLWPSLHLNLIERTFAAMRNHVFCGLIVLTPSIPEEGSFLDCSLWIAAQKMWRNISADSFLETWLSAYLGVDDGYNYVDCLKDIDNIAESIHMYTYKLKYGDQSDIDINSFKCCMNKNLYILEYLDAFIKSNKGFLLLEEYFDYFKYDIKNIIFYLLRSLNLPTASILFDNNLKNGFWTKVENSGDKGSREIRLLQLPYLDGQDPVQENIYNSTKFI